MKYICLGLFLFSLTSTVVVSQLNNGHSILSEAASESAQEIELIRGSDYYRLLSFLLQPENGDDSIQSSILANLFGQFSKLNQKNKKIITLAIRFIPAQIERRQFKYGIQVQVTGASG